MVSRVPDGAAHGSSSARRRATPSPRRSNDGCRDPGAPPTPRRCRRPATGEGASARHRGRWARGHAGDHAAPASYELAAGEASPSAACRCSIAREELRGGIDVREVVVGHGDPERGAERVAPVARLPLDQPFRWHRPPDRGVVPLVRGHRRIVVAPSRDRSRRTCRAASARTRAATGRPPACCPARCRGSWRGCSRATWPRRDGSTAGPARRESGRPACATRRRPANPRRGVAAEDRLPVHAFAPDRRVPRRNVVEMLEHLGHVVAGLAQQPLQRQLQRCVPVRPTPAPTMRITHSSPPIGSRAPGGRPRFAISPARKARRPLPVMSGRFSLAAGEPGGENTPSRLEGSAARARQAVVDARRQEHAGARARSGGPRRRSRPCPRRRGRTRPPRACACAAGRGCPRSRRRTA